MSMVMKAPEVEGTVPACLTPLSCRSGSGHNKVGYDSARVYILVAPHFFFKYFFMQACVSKLSPKI